MKTVTFTEFRRRASDLLTEVEKGGSLIVLRHGRPIAEVSPVAVQEDLMSSWKRPGLKLSAKGTSLAAAIREERASEDVL